MGAGQNKQFEKHLEELSKTLDSNPEPQSKKSKCQYIFTCYHNCILIQLIVDSLMKNQVMSIDTGEFLQMSFNNGIILGLSSKIEINNNKLKRLLTPLLQFLVNVKARHSGKEKDKYLNLDSLRIIAVSDNYKNKEEKTKIVSDILNKPLFDLIVNFILFGNNSQGVRVNPGNLKQQVKQDYCFACLTKIDKEWECGHILSVDHGGLTVVSNLKCLCKSCNRNMSSMHLYEYMLRNKLPGVTGIPVQEKKKWKAIITLSDLANEKGLEKLPLPTRLVKLSFILN